MDGRCKFDQLRIKTDRELVQLITRQLDLGLRAAAMQSDANAARAYFEAARLMRIADTGQEERARLEAKLERLASALEALAEPLELAGCLVA